MIKKLLRQSRKLVTYTAFVLAILVLLPYQAFAGAIPQHTANFFVNDFAGVLSGETANHITERNLYLSQISNAQIVMATVQFTDGVPADQFATNMFNQWGIGDATANNGVLILFITQQDDYQIRVGDGILPVLTAGELDRIAFNYIEAPFDAGNFDQAAMAAFDNIFNIVHNHYVLNPVQTTAITPFGADGVQTPAFTEVAPAAPANISGPIITVIMIMIFVILFITIFGGNSRRRPMGMGRRRGGGFGGFLAGWLMPSPLNRRRPPGSGGGFGNNTPTSRPPTRHYTGHSSPFGGGGRSGGSGFGRSSGRGGGGGRSSGGGFGRRR
ncbi:MAG: TPM domain-containing protein [Defluviitaleaceae bacterium]|nr:TPM domain-containing protein [Defluviitaleaceae bacterium]